MTSGKLEIEPLVREGASERLVHRLLGMVKAGNLKPGDRLPGERELAGLFNVSRPTIREAVKALIVLGVLKSRHGDGIFVSPLEAADLLGPISFFLSLRDVEIERLYDARALIEGEIAARAAERATEADADELDQFIAQQENVLADPVAYREVDTRLHRRLAEIADNPFLARAAESMNVLGLEFRKIASETAEVIAGSVNDHKRIVAGLRARDANAARTAMREHMERVLTTTKRAERHQETS
ncbi:FadR/GntR family transcriptional regulator [Arvimicrobium flavum]|uniref:FadR/GntR family transcriptional regulator n=1 Tax=Arvimicrobium flavum TaxID=3393320 RepID=UPI00237BCF91|nr:FadR/GntR family transcriptional regulator [Mesorhizobium shangrilense]